MTLSMIHASLSIAIVAYLKWDNYLLQMEGVFHIHKWLIVIWGCDNGLLQHDFVGIFNWY